MTHPEPKKKLSAWSLVKIPALLTLIATIIRLVGELQGWDPFWFSTEVGGTAPDGSKTPPGMFGIVFLIPLFAAYFGIRIRKNLGGPHIGRAIGIFVLAAGAVVGGFFALQAAELVSMPGPDDPPSEPQGLIFMMAALALGVALGFLAWPRLAWTLLLYGILARIPVILVTVLAYSMDWNTHYNKLAPNFPQKEGMEKLTMLIMPQATVWIGATVILGGLFGAIASTFAGNLKVRVE